MSDVREMREYLLIGESRHKQTLSAVWWSYLVNKKPIQKINCRLYIFAPI